MAAPNESPHNAKVRALAQGIYDAFVKDDSGEYLRRTGALVFQTNLRVRTTRKAFNFLRTIGDSSPSKRYWTKKAFRDAITYMMKEKNLEIPQLPGFTWEQWLKDQADSLQKLSQRSRKNAWRNMADTDHLETLEYEARLNVYDALLIN